MKNVCILLVLLAYVCHDARFRKRNINKTFLLKNSEAFIRAENKTVTMRAIYMCGALTFYGASFFFFFFAK
jgi:hypothetical protein